MTDDRLIKAADLWSDIMMLPHNGDMISSIEVEHVIKEAEPMVTREVTQAKWQKQWCDSSMIGHMYEECPICGCMILDTEKFWDCKFCPNCGTEMTGD